MLFNSCILCTFHIVISLAYVLDGSLKIVFDFFVSGYKCFGGGCGWLLNFLRWLEIVVEGFRWLLVCFSNYAFLLPGTSRLPCDGPSLCQTYMSVMD